MAWCLVGDSMQLEQLRPVTCLGTPHKNLGYFVCSLCLPVPTPNMAASSAALLARHLGCTAAAVLDVAEYVSAIIQESGDGLALEDVSELLEAQLDSNSVPHAGHDLTAIAAELVQCVKAGGGGPSVEASVPSRLLSRTVLMREPAGAKPTPSPAAGMGAGTVARTPAPSGTDHIEAVVQASMQVRWPGVRVTAQGACANADVNACRTCWSAMILALRGMR
jgi:hypothetical protein